jgi:hypothetical protein
MSRLDNSEYAKQDTLSLLTGEEIIRKMGDRVAEDGSREPGVRELLDAVAINTSLLGIAPSVAIMHATTTAKTLFVPGLVGCRIVLFDLLLSVNGIANITFTDEDGAFQLGTMYCPNAGQGYSHNTQRGLWLSQSKSLYITASAGVSYSAYATYKLVNVV